MRRTPVVLLSGLTAAVIATAAGIANAPASPRLAANPRPTRTVTTTVTATQTVTETQTATVTETAPGPTTTVTEPGPTVTVPVPTITTTVTASPSSTDTSVSPSPTPTTTAPPGCPVAGSNVPGGSDGAGGCFPGPGNTGVPAGTALTAYTGPCLITVPNTVIDAQTVNCDLDIRTTGVHITRSRINGQVDDSNVSNSSFTITDSDVINGTRETCLCVGLHDFTALRVNIDGGNRGAYCVRCTIQDSWSHHRLLGTFNGSAQHGSGVRVEQYSTLIHNTVVCDYPLSNDVTTLGCSADITGYPDFVPIHNNTIRNNLILSSTTDSFCVYGGATAGKPYSNDPTNATFIVFTGNVFQRGASTWCAIYGPVTDFDSTRTGNVWTGNVWDTGEPVPPAL